MPKRALDQIAAVARTGYPAPFKDAVKGRSAQALGDAFGLTQFGVNRVRLAPGAWSSQRHWHALEDEFVLVTEGELVLVTDAGEEVMRPGEIVGFKAGVQDGHHFQNRTQRDAVFLVVGSRVDGDWGDYPDIDLRFTPDGRYTRKDGTPY